ncbi:GNAT family N-acetyltransferase [bacterium]|nr:GNAT family N-acetyltransferase [bacterium]
MLKGDKVILRAIERQDAERLHKWMNDPEVIRFMGMRFPISLLAEENWVAQEHDPKKELRLAIDTLEGRHIGSCGLGHIDPYTHSAELGVCIGDKEYWSQGYGTDALVTLCAFGFTQMNLHRISLRVFAENTRGIRCYEKVGFQHEGTLREDVYKNGRYHNLLVMGILVHEFAELWPQRWPED